MPLTLYRRHQKGCESGHTIDLRTTEFDERKRGFKRCGCFIFASGSLAGSYKRKCTVCIDWSSARDLAAKWEAANSWTAPEVQTVAPATPPATRHITIAHAADAFFAKCQNRGIRSTTLAKYRTFNNQFLAFAASRGLTHLDQITVADMDIFYASWKDGIRAKAKKLDRLKSFIKFCIKRKWLTENITEDLQAPEGSSVNVPKSPFTDEELSRIYDACDRMITPPRPGGRNWNGEDAKDFIYLSIYTGMRISDVATFDITKRLSGNEVFLRMHKTGKPLFTWIPDWLVDRLRTREKVHGALVFKCGVTHNMKQLTDIWRGKRLATIFEMAGPFEETATPHRFRHTFVRILLEKGVPTADVAELIGDTEETLIRSYSRWIKTRQARLTNILRSAFEEEPRPAAKVVAISARSLE